MGLSTPAYGSISTTQFLQCVWQTKKTQNVFEWYYQNPAQGDHTYELLMDLSVQWQIQPITHDQREQMKRYFKTKHINKWFTERGRSTIEKWSMLNMLFFLFLCLSFPLFVSFSFPLSLLHPPPLLLFYFLTLPLWTYMAQTKSFHGWNSMEPFCLYSLSLDNCVPLIEQCSLAATLWL